MPLLRTAPAFAAALLAFAVPAAAQNQSDSYKFLQAVKDAKGDDVMAVLNKPGTTVINDLDRSSGDGALHIVVRRGDETYLRFLIGRGADPDRKNRDGDTPLMLAVEGDEPGMIDILVAARANVNLANSRGETPLIRAVQRRNVGLARQLLAAGADPDQSDVIAGLSARDYAHQDTRSPALAKLIDDTPKAVRRAVAGPKL